MSAVEEVVLWTESACVRTDTGGCASVRELGGCVEGSPVAVLVSAWYTPTTRV